MDKKIILSICIAIYNHGDYIQQTLDSIMQREYCEGLEIVIINDASTDNTDEKIRKRMSKNPKVQLVYKINQKNSGPGYTYNQALFSATGEFVSFMDSDDYFLASTLQNKIRYLQNNPQIIIVYGNGTFLLDNKTLTGDIHQSMKSVLEQGPKALYQSITKRIPLLSLSTSVVRKKILEHINGFDESRLSLNDWVLNIKLSHYANQNNYTLGYDETIAFAYRIHNNNISKNPGKQYESFDYIIQNYCPTINHKALYEEVYFVTGLRYKMIDDITHAKLYLEKLKKNNPYGLKTILSYIIIYFVPYRVLISLQTFMWRIKHYLKGKIF